MSPYLFFPGCSLRFLWCTNSRKSFWSVHGENEISPISARVIGNLRPMWRSSPDPAPQCRALPTGRYECARNYLLEGCADERDQPFILGVTNLAVPSYKAVFLALQRKFHDAGVDEVRGHLMFAMSDAEYAAA